MPLALGKAIEAEVGDMMLSFKDIAFGYASAEAERSNDPGLLIEGYID